MLSVRERFVDEDRDVIPDVGCLIWNVEELPDRHFVEEEAEIRERRRAVHVVRDNVEDIDRDAVEHQCYNLGGLSRMICRIVPRALECFRDVDDAGMYGATGAPRPLGPLFARCVLRDELRSTVPKFIVYGDIHEGYGGDNPEEKRNESGGTQEHEGALA